MARTTGSALTALLWISSVGGQKLNYVQKIKARLMENSSLAQQLLPLQKELSSFLQIFRAHGYRRDVGCKASFAFLKFHRSILASDVGRTLTGGGYTNDTGMTDESCIAYCEEKGYIYAGTECKDNRAP
jgi:hypothetical protein